MDLSRQLGDLAWARRTGGRVIGRDLAALWWHLVRSRLAARLARRPPPGFRTAHEVAMAMGEVALPTSRGVDGALALVTSLGPAALVEHVLRTFAFGSLLGLRDGLRWDRELLALAALLHDVALARRRHEHECLAHDGAEQALEVLARLGQGGPRARTVADAICLHLDVEVPRSLGVEAHLLRAGAGLDVVGARAGELGAPALRAVHQRHPRLDLGEVLDRAFVEERRRHPTARIARLVDAGFAGLVRRNPLGRS